MSTIPHFAFCPAFFAKTSRIFSFISENIIFYENGDNFQHHEDILWTEAVRKRPRRGPAMFSKPGDQKVNGNLIMNAPNSDIWRKNASIFVCICAKIDVREDENRPSRIFSRPCWHLKIIQIFTQILLQSRSFCVETVKLKKLITSYWKTIWLLQLTPSSATPYPPHSPAEDHNYVPAEAHSSKGQIRQYFIPTLTPFQ